MIVTTPPVTSKSDESKDATPLLDVVASSPEIVSVSPETDVSIPSPPETVRVSPKSTAFVAEPSESVIVEFESLPFAIAPANCVLETPLDLIETAPAVTAKSVATKDATPFAVVDASVPEIVNVAPPLPGSSTYVEEIPVPPTIRPST